MPTYQDYALLNQSLQNVGHDALLRRDMQDRRDQLAHQNELQMQRLALEDKLRSDRTDVEKQHFDAELQHYKNMEGKADKASAAKVNVTLKNPFLSGSGTMGFTGTPEDLDALMESFQKAHPGQSLSIVSKTPMEAEYETDKGKFTFHNKEDAEQFETNAEKGGIKFHRVGEKENAGKFHSAIETDPKTGKELSGLDLPANDPNVQAYLKLKPTVTMGRVPGEYFGTNPGLVTNAVPSFPQFMSQQGTSSAPSGMAAPSAQSQPHPDDVAWLKLNPNPSRISTFEKKYGQGSSQGYLNANQ